MSSPGIDQFKGVKRVFRYLKGTLDYGLKFEAQDQANVTIQVCIIE